MKFVVDQTLGGLAKWLRFCGFDTTQKLIRSSDPASLPPPAPQTRILTRQTALAQGSKRPDLLVIRAETPEAQLAEVITRLHLSWQEIKPLQRCSRCNRPLVPVSREEVLGKVPEHIYHQHREFYKCPECRRIFWEGSHVAAICHRLRAIAPQSPAGRAEESS